MKKLLVLLCLVAGLVFAVDSSLTILPVFGNGMGAYSSKAGGAGDYHLIGSNGSNQVAIDGGDNGTSFGGAIYNTGIQIVSANLVSPNTASVTINVAVTASWIIISNGQTIPTATINLPATPNNGYEIYITPVSAISLVTLSALGNTIVGGVTSFTANTPVHYSYVTSKNTYYRK